nr:MAG TPA: SEX HORMONE-BINDING GLOBULIN TRANSPORT, LAMININ G-LIKE DOMAIN [Caudoviricetes sp.]
MKVYFSGCIRNLDVNSSSLFSRFIYLLYK